MAENFGGPPFGGPADHGRSPTRFVGADSLASGDREAAAGLLRRSGQSGVLVGALLGEARWDLRPVLLDRGTTYLLRFSDPAVGSEIERLRWFFDVAQQLSGLPELSGIVQSGELDRRVWVKRRYYQYLLSDPQSRALFHGAVDVEQLFSVLVQVIKELHERGFVHGHVCPENIALDSSDAARYRPVLLDPCWLVSDPGRVDRLRRNLEQSKRHVAPEILGAKPAASPADVYGLGLIAKQLAAWGALERLPSDARALLEAGLQLEPWSRPVLTMLDQVLLPESPQVRGAPLGGVSRGVRSGKIITPRVRVAGEQGGRQPPPPPPPAPAPPPHEVRQDPQPEADDVAATVLIRPPSPPPPQPARLLHGVTISPTLVRSLVVLALVAVLFAWQSGFLKLPRSGPPPSELLGAWTSNQPSQMLKVAALALDEQDDVASEIIVNDALSGSNRPQVHLDFMRLALNPAWERELSDEDRIVILKLALRDLIPLAPDTLSSLGGNHPAVILVVAASIDPEKGGQFLRGLSVKAMEILPAPYGPSFAGLASIGVDSMSDHPAIALSHILVSDISPAVLGYYFGGAKDDKALWSRLLLLLTLIDKYPALEGPLFEYASRSSGTVGETMGWFAAEDTLKWGALAKRVRLSIVAGKLPEQDLEFEYLADLLKHPLDIVRRAAERRLVESGTVDEQLLPSLSVISSTANRLERVQSLSLLIALRTGGEKGEALIGTWFKTRPDPESVLNLLIARRNIVGEDAFNLEAARYLDGAKWKPDLERLKLLAGHPEPLARVLAATRLDPTRKEDAALLKTMATVEPRESVRKAIQDRLKQFEG